MKNRSTIAFVWPVVLLVLLMPAAGLGSIQLEFDYTYDSSGFFSAGTQARASLDAVGDFYESILDDDLNPINPSGSSNLRGSIWQPDTEDDYITIEYLSIAADTVRIYVGACDLPGNTLGQAGPGGYSGWPISAVTRGEGLLADVQGTAATEYAPWGGSMSIDSGTTWNYDYTANPVTGENDLYSVMLHEVGHVLGLGTADSWDNLVSGGQFLGTAAVAEYGSTVPIDTASGSHWAGGTTSTAFGTNDSQVTLMTPSITTGTRKLATDLDVAAMDDIGWDINYPPATPAWIQSAGGLFSLGSNWNIGTKPLSTDPVEFHLTNAYTVSFAANESSASVLIDAGTVAFNLGSHTYAVDSLTITGGSTRLDITNGTLAVATEATVGIGSDLVVGSGGVLQLDGLLDGDVAINAGGTYRLSGLHFGSVDVNAGGTLSGDGLIDLDLTNAGTVDVGSQIERAMDVGGDYMQTASGKLVIEIGGESMGTEYGHLEVSGAAYLDGELEIVFTDGFTTGLGMVFNLLSYDGYVGTFETITVADIPNMHILYYDNGLFMFTAFAGDINADGIVDNNDALILADNWLATDATWIHGDFNADGIVNEIDATLLAANMHSGAGSASVPAPSAGILLLSAFAMLAAVNRRRVSRT